MAISKHIRKAMSGAYHEYWEQFPASERDMIRRDLKRKGKHSLSAIELYHLKGLLARRGEVEDWIQKIDGHVDYEENKHEIIATYGEPLPGEETDAEAREKMEEVEAEHRDYIIKNLEEAIEVQFEFEDMKRSLDMVTGDVEKLTKTIKKFVTKKDLKSELKGMEDRITKKITEKITKEVSMVTTEQIRKELQRLREEYARLPPEVPPEIPPKIEIVEEEIVEEEIEAPSRGYLRELRWVKGLIAADIEKAKTYLTKYRTSPPYDMSESERLKMIEGIINKLIDITPENEEGISNIERVQKSLMDFDIPDALKKKLIETLDNAELARYAILI